MRSSLGQLTPAEEPKRTRDLGVICRQGARTDLVDICPRGLPDGGKSAPGKPRTNVQPFEPVQTRDEVAKRVGFGSGCTYERAKQVLEAIEAQPDGAQLIECDKCRSRGDNE